MIKATIALMVISFTFGTPNTSIVPMTQCQAAKAVLDARHEREADWAVKHNGGFMGPYYSDHPQLDSIECIELKQSKAEK